MNAELPFAVLRESQKGGKNAGSNSRLPRIQFEEPVYCQ